MNKRTREELAPLVARLFNMLWEVEWVRQEGGKLHACAFCKAISERDSGPGHTDDCEWQAMVREVTALQVAGEVPKL